MTNLKEIQLALLNYESAKGSLPPAYIADATAKPMHSWRVLILPYLGEMALYNKYNFNEPWNGPNNSKLAAQVPDVFRCCPSEGKCAESARRTISQWLVRRPQAEWAVANSPVHRWYVEYDYGDRGQRTGDKLDGAARRLA